MTGTGHFRSPSLAGLNRYLSRLVEGRLWLQVLIGMAAYFAAGVALIMGVDRLLDMSQTAVNVSGDLGACTFIDRWVLRNTNDNNKKPGG